MSYYTRIFSCKKTGENMSMHHNGADTVAVVVTYNRLDLLKKNIECLRKQTARTDILLIDNASTDGTGEWARQQDDIQYVNPGENLGGAGGFSYGMKKAAEAGYPYIWIMDDDCLPKENALEAFLKADQELNGQYGWLSSVTLWTDGKLCPMNVQRATPYREAVIQQEAYTPVAMASFVSLFLKRDTIVKYGLPIKEFFIWTDDWEFTRRISRQEKCYVVKNSMVVHAMKNNTVVNIATDTEERLSRYAYFYRNDVVLYRREGVKGWLWLIFKDIYHSVLVIKSGKIKRISVIWRGFFEGIIFKPTIGYVVAKEKC